MKHYLIKALFLISTMIFCSTPAFAAVLITTPLDSRPISTDYLKNLAALHGDTVKIAGEKNLDFFSDHASQNYFADSDAVRNNLTELVKKNNKEDTTVIINTSTYLTGGLVGSRSFSNYSNFETGLEELHTLLETYPSPSYYLNLVMPRNLPETRGNIIWPDEEKIRGLAYYYLNYHRDSPNKEEIESKYSRVTPSEFLLEWGYVENKAKELGEHKLTDWEKDFLQFFREYYLNTSPYDEYIENYTKPFQDSAIILQHILRWQKKGLLDEIVISNDDSQLPSSVSYLYFNTKDNDWITLEKDSPVKYSFARTYTTSADTSIRQYIFKNYSKKEAELSLEGKSENINFIFGLDEVPQLIYARDLAKRTNLSANFQTFSYSENALVESYDVLNAGNLLKNGLNYLDVTKNKTDKITDFYLFGYDGDVDLKTTQILADMEKSNENGHFVALTELYSYSIVSAGKNTLFQTLFNRSVDGEFGITNLSSFSAWNTNANAIGLGLAHAQVASICSQITENQESFLEAQIKMLAQHILEDGLYIGQGKYQLIGQGFSPQKQDILESEALLKTLSTEKVFQAFFHTDYKQNNTLYKIKDISLTSYGFPWQRLFDCYIDLSVEVTKK